MSSPTQRRWASNTPDAIAYQDDHDNFAKDYEKHMLELCHNGFEQQIQNQFASAVEAQVQERTKEIQSKVFKELTDPTETQQKIISLVEENAYLLDEIKLLKEKKPNTCALV